ncbi:MAG: hydrogenase iron-sulfur subunit, partial [Thermoplasmata archaeon]
RTAKRFPIMERMLNYIGINPKRLKLDWVSASEGERYQKVMTEFIRDIKELGPNELTAANREVSP